MELEQIQMVKIWPKSKSVWDIQVFLSFANFYYWFIKSFSTIATSLMSMLIITMSSKVFATNEVLGARMFAANKVGDVGHDDRLKHVEPKIKRSKS